MSRPPGLCACGSNGRSCCDDPPQRRSGIEELRPVPGWLLVQAFRTKGIVILTNMPVTSVNRDPDHLIIRAVQKGEQTFEADMVIHGAGREPNFSGLNLKAGGVQVDEKGIAINQHLQSISNSSVYVAGDTNARGKALSPVARMEGRMAARNMIRGNTLTPDYLSIPSVVYIAAARISGVERRRGCKSRD